LGTAPFIDAFSFLFFFGHRDPLPISPCSRARLQVLSFFTIRVPPFFSIFFQYAARAGPLSGAGLRIFTQRLLLSFFLLSRGGSVFLSFGRDRVPGFLCVIDFVFPFHRGVIAQISFHFRPVENDAADILAVISLTPSI